MLRFMIAVLALAGLFAPAAASAGGDADLSAACRSIDPIEAYTLCRKIASAQFAGRLTGHEGYTAAAEWAASTFAEWGLAPAGDGEGYLQAYPSPYTVVDSARMVLHPAAGGDREAMAPADTVLAAGIDFMPQLFTDAGSRDAGLVFAGWGISAPELGWDDYAGIDAAGRFVVCFRGTPGGGEKFEPHDEHRKRMETAKDKGAAGLLYIYPEPIANPNGDRIEGFMTAIISEKTADLILAEKGTDCGRLKNDLSGSDHPLSFALNATISYDVASRHFPSGTGYNVAAYIEGSSPEHRGECVVVGGHLDHCGLHMGMLFTGANDNASGSATVMAIARAFSALGEKPKRSVVFVLFGGEEKGLEGSRRFAGALPRGFERVDAMFNFDMTGEGEGVNCGYTPDPPGLLELIQRAGAEIGALRRTWKIEHVGVRSSDFAPFFLNGASCAAFFSNGPHLHYHMTGDTIHRINPEILADTARLGFLAAYRWADR
ncbi:MAG: M20/M25/M40 family metallo-hydrolase [Candidatus Krumholzibacteria bacterium]|nr:M20/M25/M40 family metallo-hydrolase [Candidatus Krumholzibacteria bacterium]